MLDINDILDIYPQLSKYIITNAISNGDLKVTWIGNKRYFKLIDIEHYLNNKQEKMESIADTIKTWRNVNGE